MRARALVLAALVLAPTAGCIEVVRAGVPTALLSAHGWRENETLRASQSEWLGLARAETRAYEDKAPGAGHPGRMWVYTLKAPLTPDASALVPELRERVEDQARAQGIRIGPVEHRGERSLLNGARTEWFVYNGSVQSTNGLFARDAEIRILGEVWTCAATRSVVAVVSIAQLTNAQTVGGILRQTNRDPTTWREVVADPQGTIEGARGNEGLAWNVVCR